MQLHSLDPGAVIGRVLGDRYRIVRELGSGGMATIYEAMHVTLGMGVAVKILSRKYAQNAMVVTRFLNEARALALLDHPNVVRIVDFDLVDQEPYMVLELLVGETLSSRLLSGKVSPDAALRIAAQIGSALSAAHEKGVIHRDVKPENVFLSPRKDSLMVKLLDFGISRFVRANESRVTRELEVVGTAEYMAPEQAQGRSDVDARADQYSLALVTYEMLTGCSPFADESVEDSLRRVVIEAPTHAHRVDPRILPGVSAVLDTALAKEPNDRFGSVDEFVSALSSAWGVARPYSVAPEVGREPGWVTVDFDSAPTEQTRLQQEQADVPIVFGGTGEQDPTRWLIGAIARVHSCLAHGDLNTAVSLTMTILDAGELLHDPAASSILDFSRGLFESVLRARLEPLDRAILVDRVRLGSRASESPAAAFMLTRLDGWVTIDDVLDFAGPLRLASLRLLVELEQQNIVCLPRSCTLRTVANERSRRAG
jgi:tRNA A-37 threonylcarbamoyl transferase component Bud32